MKKILTIVFVILFAFLFGQTVSAQTASGSAAAAKYGITFPIAELGNCSDVSACRTYCQDEANKDACVAFAKAKGFYKEVEKPKASVLAAAKTELGCDSAEACRTFCQEKENHDACVAFAKKYNLGFSAKDPGSASVVQKAKQVLGCSSEAACKALCQDTANQQKCSEFAKLVGLRGGEQKVGPGGCTSESSCKTFCSDPSNFTTCSEFTAQVRSKESSSSAQAKSVKFRGPGGCDSEEACKTYCSQNPDKCSRTSNKAAELRNTTASSSGKPASNPSPFELPKKLETRPTGAPTLAPKRNSGSRDGAVTEETNRVKKFVGF